MGRVAKGVKCSVKGCNNPAVRSLAAAKVSSAGLDVGSGGVLISARSIIENIRRELRRRKGWISGDILFSG